MSVQAAAARLRGAANGIHQTAFGAFAVSFLVAFSIAAQPERIGALRIGGPDFEPPGLAPSASRTQVAVTGTVAGVERMPASLFLEEVTEAGRPLRIVAELADDGEGYDEVARDGRYAAAFELGGNAESERFFRLRATREDGPTTSGVVFPVTNLPIGFPPPNPGDAIPSRRGFSDAIANFVSFTAARGVGPTRIQIVLAEVGAELGTNIEILGYSPGLNGYVARFTGERTFDAIQRVADALDRHPEIDDASPSYFGTPAAVQWWQNTTNVTTLRSTAPNSSLGTALRPPVRGDNAVEVAVIEIGFGGAGAICQPGSGLDSKCLPNPNTSSCAYSTTNANHGRKVASLIASAEPPAASFADIEGGVAPSTMLLPLSAASSYEVGDALNCASTRAEIVNMSLAFDLGNVGPPDEDANLRAGICAAVCHDVLLVAAAGNNACAGPPELPHPGAYADSMETCTCGMTTQPIKDFMLSVGATTDTDALGDTCGTNSMKSRPGDIFAPGWGLSDTDSTNDPPAAGDFGTSWAAPQVAGCAAVIGAVEVWAGGPDAWDAPKTEALLRTSADNVPSLGPRLNCLAAVRRPYDVVFSLDRSGSMSEPAGTTPTPTRWEVLSNAVSEFVVTMQSTAPPGSQVGVTLFSTAFPGMTSDPLPGMLPMANGLPAGTLSQVPSGGTPMGAGLQAAVGKLTSPNRPRVVVLFTDGVQNAAPFVWDGCTYSSTSPYPLSNPATPTNPAAITTPCPGDSGSVKILPIGVGSPSTDYLTTLQVLAANHRAPVLITDNLSTFTGATCAANIAAAFECGVAPVLYGSSLQMIDSVFVPLVPNRSLLEFDVNPGVTSLVIKLRAQQTDFDFGRFVDRLNVTRDGADVTAYFRKALGAQPTSVLLSTNFLPPPGSVLPDLASDGKYQVRLLANPDVDVLLARLRDPISALAFADEHRLDMSWAFTPVTPRVGQSVRPRVTLRWAGEPITDAQVTARVFRPGDDLGDALARNSTRVDVVSGPDAASPGWQKYDRLWRTDAAFRAQLAPRENALTLVHRGDGVYDAAFDPGDVSGVYQIVYEVRAQRADFGAIQREGAESVYVRFGTFDFDASYVTHAVQGNNITLTLKPAATNGRLVGPGQASIFGVSGGSARIASVTDHQDGTYTLVFAADPSSDIELNVLGEPVYTGPADFEQRRRWWWALVVLILAALA